MTTQTPNSNTASAATGTPVTPRDIARAIILDRQPRLSDGTSYADLVSFILGTFDCDSIGFDEVFDYGCALQSRDLQVIYAFRGLATLQSAYTNTLWTYGWLTDEERDALITHFELMVTHIDWHIGYVRAGIPTPPLNIIN